MPRASNRNTDDDARRLIGVTRALAAEVRGERGRTPEITLESALEHDIGLDSLSRVELLARLEREFGVSLSEASLATAETPGDLLRAIAGVKPPSGGGERSTAATAPLEAIEDTPRAVETLTNLLDWHARRHPDRPHVRLYDDTADDGGLTYGALHARAETLAAGLQDRGLRPRESVVLMLPTGLDYFAAFTGVLLAGGIPVPVYPPARMNQIEEHLRRHVGIVNNAQAAILITVPEVLPVARLLRAQTETLRAVTTAAELEGTGGTLRRPAAKASDIAFLQYTSGSTAAPKGVALTHANLLANIRAMGRALEASSEDVIVSWLPLYHDMGLIGAWMGSLYYAAAFTVMSPLFFLARPQRWLQAIHRHRGTISAAPNFAYDLCLRRIEEADIEGLDLSSWRIAANGAEPISPDIMRRFCDRFGPFGFRRTTMMPMFGLAENCVGLAFPPLGREPLTDRVKRDALMASGRAEPAGDDDPKPMEFVACGRPLPGHEIRIADEAGRELPERREGRIQFRGPSATSGYFRNAKATRALFSDGWLETGDRGYLAGGDLFVTGRTKDLIIRAGRNIHPAEIEDAVGNLKRVRRGGVAAFATPDPKTGAERLAVVAETRTRDAARREELQAEITGLVADLIGVAPDIVALAPPNAVPKTSSGKIRRAACREFYEKGQLGQGRTRLWIQLARLGLHAILPLARRIAGRTGEALYAAHAAFLLLVVIGPLGWILTALMPCESWRWPVVRGFARALFRGAAIPLTVRGLANLPPTGQSFVLVSNHQSYLDGTVLVAALPRPLRFVAKAELARQFVAGIFLRRLGTRFVERFDANRSANDAKRIASKAKAGHPLVYFAEGTFIRAGGLLPFHMGAFIAAAEAGVPVVPVALRGTRAILRSGSWIPRRGRIQVLVGAPIIPPENAESPWIAALSLRDRTRAFILEHCGEPDLSHENPPPPGQRPA